MNVEDPIGLAYQYTCDICLPIHVADTTKCQVLSRDNCTLRLSYTVASFLFIVLVYAVYSDVCWTFILCRNSISLYLFSTILRVRFI